MEVIMAKKTTLGKLCEPVTVYPQVLVNLRVADKEAALTDSDVKAAVRKAEKALEGSGRILFRASGTEPVVRVMVEAETDEICRIRADEVVQVLRKKGHVVS